MEVKDVRELKEELEKALSEMIVKFEYETGCAVKYIDIMSGSKPSEKEVELQLEI